ncbi:MAG: ribonuclease III [Myxococcota bacterium]
MSDPTETVAGALGHRFTDPGLLEEALTHRSLRNERPNLAPRDNERLEFLGDAVLDLVVSALLWEAHPEAPEGELTRRRADLVCENTLSEVARDMGIGPAIRLGRGEERSGGREKPRLLASALEACMGAVYLDGGFAQALEVGRRLLSGRLGSVRPGASDFKSRLQETTQRAGAGTPTYELVRTDGPDHDRVFVVAVCVGDRTMAEAEGRSKLEAEQSAACSALEAWRQEASAEDPTALADE